MSLERIKFVQSKFGSLFQKSDLTIFLNPDAPSYCLSFAFERLGCLSNFLPGCGSVRNSRNQVCSKYP